MASNSCVGCKSPTDQKHFGQFCCCKGFFRRSIRFKRQYVCAYNNSCDVTLENRTECRACRLRICLENGMNPSKICDDRTNDLDFVSKKKKFNNSDDKEVHSKSLITYTSSPESQMIPQTTDLALNSRFNMATNVFLPLGARQILPPFDKANINNVIAYMSNVQNLIDNFRETEINIFDKTIYFNLNVSLSDGVYYSPGSMCRRTKMDFSETYYFGGGLHEKAHARFMLYYADWASHFLMMEDLDVEDKIRLLLARFVPLSYQLVTLKMIDTKQRNILFGCGCYLPSDEQELLSLNHAPPFTKMCLDLSNVYLDYYVEPLREIRASEAELQLLCLLSLFTPVKGLTEKGRKTIMAAKRYYCEVLQKTIHIQNPSLSHDDVTERIGTLLCTLPCLEKLHEIEDNFYFMMIMHCAPFMKKPYFEDYCHRHNIK